jgi:hypothetical protein
MLFFVFVGVMLVIVAIALLLAATKVANLWHQHQGRPRDQAADKGDVERRENDSASAPRKWVTFSVIAGRLQNDSVLGVHSRVRLSWAVAEG